MQEKVNYLGMSSLAFHFSNMILIYLIETNLLHIVILFFFVGTKVGNTVTCMGLAKE